MDRNPRKFDPREIKQPMLYNVNCYITIRNKNIPCNWPAGS